MKDPLKLNLSVLGILICTSIYSFEAGISNDALPQNGKYLHPNKKKNWLKMFRKVITVCFKNNTRHTYTA
jgi:hypothetical protein